MWGMMAALLADDPDPLQLAGPLTPVLHGLLRKDPDQRMSPDEAGRLLRQIARGPAPAQPQPPLPYAPPPHNMTLQPPPAAPTVESPSWPTQPPAGGPRPPRRRRPPWPLIIPGGIFAAALAVAVVAVVVFTGNGDEHANDPPTSSAGSSSSPSAKVAVPSGYRLYQGSAFVAAVPQGWKDEGSGDDASFTDQAPGVRRGLAIQRVSNTDFADPGDGLVDALDQMKKDTAEYPEFKQESINRKVAYLGDQAAEAQFTFTKNNIPGRARVRVFRFDDAIYQVIIVAGQQHWDGAVPVYDTFLKTLRSSA
ncbi:hypothetical protein [Actinomadura sp. 3N508]|uniref:hypothetical protein n=1 Tax=Actinomadura sp. 3N508 TaxID=3375153 RepID=UPI0037A8F3A3